MPKRFRRAAAMSAGLYTAVALAAAAAAGPTVSTGGASAVTDTSAVVSGSVNPNGSPTTYAFQYGPSTLYGQQTPMQSAGSGTSPSAVSATLSGLPPGTPIHFRLIARNSAGALSLGNDATFTTTGTPPPAPAPTATTLPPTRIVGHGAAVNGLVGPSSNASTYFFEYGPTTDYGTQTAPQTLGPATVPRAVVRVLTALQSATTYHYRLVVVSPAGLVSVGKDAQFTTPIAARFRARGLTLSARGSRGGSRARISAAGRLLLPAGLGSRQGCSGIVSIQISGHGLTLSSRTVGVSRSCRYGERVSIVRSRLGGAHAVRVTATFRGNDAVQAASARPVTVRV